MTLNIRSEDADALAQELARIDGITVAEAVVSALREALESRVRRETPGETASRILKERGLTLQSDHREMPSGVLS